MNPHLPAGWPAVAIADANAALSAPGSPLALIDTEIDGVNYKTYAEAPTTLKELFDGGRVWNDRDFIVYEDERVSFAANALAVDHFSKVLVETYGIKKGDRIAIIMRNYPQWPVAFFAGLNIGAIVTPMN
ncbi:MAG: AMP-binding protein, partial [Pseudomonadota bacterium]